MKTPEQKLAYNQRRRELYASDPDYRAKVKSWEATYLQAHREDVRVKDRKRSANRRARATPEYKERQRVYFRAWKLATKYGLTVAQYQALLSSQDGKCAICAVSLVKPCVDHNHKTGAVRGILCDGCNVGLGRFADNPQTLRRAADYLEGG